MPNINSLPKWAQDVIQDLNRENNSMKSRLATLTGSVDSTTSAVFDPYSQTPLPLESPDGRDRIEYRMGQREHITISRVPESPRALEIYSMAGPIRITASASNVFVIEPVDRAAEIRAKHSEES